MYIHSYPTVFWIRVLPTQLYSKFAYQVRVRAHARKFMVLRYYVNYYVGGCSFQVSEFLEPLPIICNLGFFRGQFANWTSRRDIGNSYSGKGRDRVQLAFWQVVRWAYWTSMGFSPDARILRIDSIWYMHEFWVHRLNLRLCNSQNPLILSWTD